MGRYTSLGSSTTNFASMINRFGVVTVMNADVYDLPALAGEDTIADFFKDRSAHEVLSFAEAKKTAKDSAYICTLDTLKVANATQEGPSKTVNGGRYANPLLKFGKSMRLEMQDALGNNKALDALCGTVTEYSDKENGSVAIAVHSTEDFTGEKLIIGDTFFIDQLSGSQVAVKIIFFRFLPDSIFNLTQDAEGDATVFDMNGDLLTAELLVGSSDGKGIVHGSFYAIVDPKSTAVFES